MNSIHIYNNTFMTQFEYVRSTYTTTLLQSTVCYLSYGIFCWSHISLVTKSGIWH